jgi:hypothetical protein
MTATSTDRRSREYHRLARCSPARHGRSALPHVDQHGTVVLDGDPDNRRGSLASPRTPGGRAAPPRDDHRHPVTGDPGWRPDRCRPQFRRPAHRPGVARGRTRSCSVDDGRRQERVSSGKSRSDDRDSFGGDGGGGGRGLRDQRPPRPGLGPRRCLLVRDDCLRGRSARRRCRHAIHRTGEQAETVGLDRLRAVRSATGCCHDRSGRGIRLGLGPRRASLPCSSAVLLCWPYGAPSSYTPATARHSSSFGCCAIRRSWLATPAPSC